jgi:DNA-binding NarL/FixJ family response regulator
MRAVIVDDHAFARAGVVKLLELGHIEVVAETGTPQELFNAVVELHPDVAVVDVRLPPSNTDEGVRLARRLRRDYPNVGILLLSAGIELVHARRLFSENPRGGVGYLLKEHVADAHEFAASVRRVAAGGTAVDPDVVSQLLGGTRARDPSALDQLSPRELEVLALMAEGLSNDGICKKLFLSAKTVETHITSIFSKLDLPMAAGEHRRVRAVLTYLDLVAERAIADPDQGLP